MSNNPAQQQLDKMIDTIKQMTKDPTTETFHQQKHAKYANFILHDLGKYIMHFQYAQPWIHYYCIHSLKTIGYELSEEDCKKMKEALRYCGGEGGGFGGGYLQLPHLAPTYAAFLAILELGPQAYDLLDKQKLYSFFKKCKQGNKFMMHQHGELDLRAIFIVTLITKTLHLNQDILQGIEQTIIKSQTYEGGLSNIIGGQAHGGFTYCGIAALALLKKLQNIDISRLLLWLSQRQVMMGGFNGRTNKLIDSCYSHWIGGVYNILNDYFQGKISIDQNLLYSQIDLQKYIIFYCQDGNGGLWDKPGKGRDIYHTCYAISGLAHAMEFDKKLKDTKIIKIEPIYNITMQSYEQAKQYFK